MDWISKYSYWLAFFAVMLVLITVHELLPVEKTYERAVWVHEKSGGLLVHDYINAIRENREKFNETQDLRYKALADYQMVMMASALDNNPLIKQVYFSTLNQDYAKALSFPTYLSLKRMFMYRLGFGHDKQIGFQIRDSLKVLLRSPKAGPVDKANFHNMEGLFLHGIGQSPEAVQTIKAGLQYKDQHQNHSLNRLLESNALIFGEAKMYGFGFFSASLLLLLFVITYYVLGGMQSYLHFGMYLLSVSVVIGIGFMFIQIPAWNYGYSRTPLLIALWISVHCFFLFVKEFIQEDEHRMLCVTVPELLLAVGYLWLALAWMGQYWLVTVRLEVQFLLTIVLNIYLLILLVKLKKTSTSSSYIMIAGVVWWIVAFTIANSIIIMNSNIEQNSVLTVLIGLSGQIIIFTLALVFQSRERDVERLEAKEALLHQLQENEMLIMNRKEELEREVELRTKELFDKNESLLQANEEIERQRDEVIAARDALQESLEKLQSAQAQLIQQEKLASLGQLTAGIAHEIKNPLNFVNNFSSVSLELVQEVEEELEKLGDEAKQTEIPFILTDIKTNLQKINEHGTRADRIVKSMLQHSRSGSTEKEPTNINQLLKEFTNLSFHGMRSGPKRMDCDIVFELDEHLGEVLLNAQDISRVILNLTNNAFDAMWEKKQQNEAYQPKLIVRSKNQKSQVCIEIEDNGPGIPNELKDKIMQPFFTTKKGTEGTGLGLSITHDIVKGHGGEINIKNTSQSGVTIILMLNKSQI